MRHARTTLESSDGILVARVGPGGVWEAFRDLRAGLATAGDVRASFLTALTEEGEIATEASAAALLVLGYRV